MCLLTRDVDNWNSLSTYCTTLRRKFILHSHFNGLGCRSCSCIVIRVMAGKSLCLVGYCLLMPSALWTLVSSINSGNQSHCHTQMYLQSSNPTVKVHRSNSSLRTHPHCLELSHLRSLERSRHVLSNNNNNNNIMYSCFRETGPVIATATWYSADDRLNIHLL